MVAEAGERVGLGVAHGEHRAVGERRYSASANTGPASSSSSSGSTFQSETASAEMNAMIANAGPEWRT